MGTCNSNSKRGGGSSGTPKVLKRGQAFSYKTPSGKTKTIEYTKSGAILVDGNPQHGAKIGVAQAQKLYNIVRNTKGFKMLSSAKLHEDRNKKREERSKHDYEMQVGVPSEFRIRNARKKLVY